MLKKINLSHLKACDQNWEEMTPVERGRICRQCQKTIIDFRAMSDEEVARIHVFEDRTVCGVYRKDQIITPKRHIAKPKLSRWKSLLFGLTGFFSSFSINGQTESEPIKVEQTESKGTAINMLHSKQRNSVVVVKGEPIILSGTLKDENGDVVIGANVVVKNTQYGTSTDFDGYYQLNISEYFNHQDSITIQYLYVGFGAISLDLSKTDLLTPESRIRDQQFTLTEMEELAVTNFYVYTPPRISVWRKFTDLFKLKKN